MLAAILIKLLSILDHFYSNVVKYIFYNIASSLLMV